ncbi:MAG: glycine--tRNA ligase subunit beta, partial [Campylobacter sp.]|nr:glycine--tRNA ligase subunit beta [Campylobacter sp.]
GIMGGYYAKAKNEHALVARAISEQYLPNGENSELPKGIFSSVVAMAVKFETLFALFSIDKIPSGNKDPYALRRAALGLIKIALNSDLNLDIKSLSDEVLVGYKKFDTQKLLNFIKDRLYTLYEFNPSVVKACINSGENDIKKLNNAIIALGEISVSSEFKDNFATFKRLANIIKDEKIGSLDESLFESDAERALNSAFGEIEFNGDYKAYLNSLFGLKGEIDEFFDKVMINVNDPKIKANRIANIGQIYNAFLKVADIKEISF